MNNLTCVQNDIIPDGQQPVIPCVADDPCAVYQSVDYVTLAQVTNALGDNGLTDEKKQFLSLLITRSSELLDDDCGVEHGFFAPAPEQATTKVFQGNGTIFIQTPRMVPGSLEFISINGQEISPDIVMKTEAGITLGTMTGQHLGCCKKQPGCLQVETFSPSRFVFWQGAVICITARWGFPKVQQDVVQAVIDMVLQLFRRADPSAAALQTADGQSLFNDRRPLSWYILVNRYRGQHEKKKILSAFGL